MIIIRTPNGKACWMRSIVLVVFSVNIACGKPAMEAVFDSDSLVYLSSSTEYAPAESTVWEFMDWEQNIDTSLITPSLEDCSSSQYQDDSYEVTESSFSDMSVSTQELILTDTLQMIDHTESIFISTGDYEYDSSVMISETTSEILPSSTTMLDSSVNTEFDFRAMGSNDNLVRFIPGKNAIIQYEELLTLLKSNKKNRVWNMHV